MSDDYFNVSGTDRSDRPGEIFVWCRADGRADYALVETGFAVSAADVRPPGIQVGQFSVTFRLPADCAVDSLIVTTDKNAEQLLSDVAVTRCS